VIEEKSPFYFYEDIENFRKSLLQQDSALSKIARGEDKDRNYGALLSRIVNFFKCKNVMQIGGSTGIMGLYAAFPLRKTCRCFVLEEREGLLDEAAKFASGAGLSSFQAMEGNFDRSFAKLKSENLAFDLIFINLFGNADKTAQILQEIQPFVYDKTALIIDNINGSPEMKRLWEDVKNSPKTGVSVDLYALGIVFFSKKLNKHHYKCYFDYGKKQNLHKKRGRRFHLISHRKKGSENRPPA
jgi:predicted O-methyltransferase YrrM